MAKVVYEIKIWPVELGMSTSPIKTSKYVVADSLKGLLFGGKFLFFRIVLYRTLYLSHCTCEFIPFIFDKLFLVINFHSLCLAILNIATDKFFGFPIIIQLVLQ